MSFWPKVDWRVINLKLSELISSNTPTGESSYSNNGKAAVAALTTGSIVMFVVHVLVWVAPSLAQIPALAPYSSLIWILVWFVGHSGYLKTQDGSPEKVEAIKQKIEAVQATDEPPDDPKPPNPPLRMSP